MPGYRMVYFDSSIWTRKRARYCLDWLEMEDVKMDSVQRRAQKDFVQIVAEMEARFFVLMLVSVVVLVRQSKMT